MSDSDLPSMWFQPPTYRGHDAYIYDTAILRSNRLIGQEAKSVLYGGNMFVLFNLTDDKCAYYMISDSLRNVAWNPVRKDAPVPSCVVQIDHVIKDHTGPSLIVAAADVNLICKRGIEKYFFRHGPRAAYSLVALPQLGWPHEFLLTMIWLPLKALREPICTNLKGDGNDYVFTAGIKIIDCTGVFEQTIGMYKQEDFEMGSLSKSNSYSDPIEDESDGSGSERSKNGDNDSCDEEEEDREEDMEDVGRTSNGSDDVAHEESKDEEASPSGESGEGDLDEAASTESHELCSIFGESLWS